MRFTFRINCRNPALLDEITIPTGETQVIQFVRAAQGFGNNVIDSELNASDLLLSLAVAALVVRAGSNGLAISWGKKG